MTAKLETSTCPTCGALHEKGHEPWLLPKLHCTKHDFVHPAGTECDHCVSEAQLAAVQATEEEAAKKAAEEKSKKTTKGTEDGVTT